MVKPDLFDVCIIAGFGSMVAGIWMLSPPWALILGGLGAISLGLLGSWRKGGG